MDYYVYSGIYEFVHCGVVEVAVIFGIVNHYVASNCIDEQAIVKIVHRDYGFIGKVFNECGCEAVAHPDSQIGVKHVGFGSLIGIGSCVEYHARKSGTTVKHAA